MGMFDEDRNIKVSTIINLWVSEGFLKPTKNKNLETVASEFLHELVDRNLVLARDEVVPRVVLSLTNRELGLVGNNLKMCRLHDLVRDVCLREAKKQKFYYVYSEHNPPRETSSQRRSVIPDNTWYAGGLESWPHLRSYVCHDYSVWEFPDFRLLRTLHTTYRGADSRKHKYTQEDVFGLVNARLLAIAVEQDQNNVLRSSISRLWSLHTLLVYSDDDLEGPVELWNMRQLKHVVFTCGRLSLQLPPPTSNDHNIVALENLHTLIGMKDFHLNEDVVRRIPNLTIFDVRYEKKMNREAHCLSYLQHLSKLESFRCSVKYEIGEDLHTICFPQSLKQILVIDGYGSLQIKWEEVLHKIGALPLVEELMIQDGIFRSRNWETVEGQFPRLKTLELLGCGCLDKWTVSDASHFPLLQKLFLGRLEGLEEIPSEIGEIATLKSIEVNYCRKSIVLSAKKIVEEQEELYGEEELSFGVLVVDWDTDLASLAGPNFKVELDF